LGSSCRVEDVNKQVSVFNSDHLSRHPPVYFPWAVLICAVCKIDG
jgi:hypothetical protein